MNIRIMAHKKFSIEWKYAQANKKGGWAQKHGDFWHWHYIQYDTEFKSDVRHLTKLECEIRKDKQG